MSASATSARAVDPESRIHADHHASLRLWLRLFTCTARVERTIRMRLRVRFATTLPRFDLMAQLERHRQGLRMGELSQRLLVTGGNVTGITNQLVAEGLVERRAAPEDRRAFVVRLTAKGKRQFDLMASVHEQWLVEILSGLEEADRTRLYGLLGLLQQALKDTPADDAPQAPARRSRGVQR